MPTHKLIQCIPQPAEGGNVPLMDHEGTIHVVCKGIRSACILLGGLETPLGDGVGGYKFTHTIFREV